jgi:hypothetical protein
MISAPWFRRTKTPDVIPAKADIAKTDPAATPHIEAPAKDEAANPEVATVETVAAPVVEKPTPAAAGTLRASRLVEAGRKTSTDLGSRARALFVAAEPWGKPAGAAAALVVVGALGFAGGSLSSGRGDDVSTLRWSEASAGIRENREDVARLASEMKSVRTALEGLKGDRRAGDPAAKQAQLIERSAAETSGRIAKLAEQLDRMEKVQRDPARISAITERLERIEKQVQTASLAPQPQPQAATLAAAAPTKPAAAAPAIGDVTSTGSLPTDARPPVRPAEAATDPRKLPAEGYTLRDLEDGFALVEGRNGRFFEVSPGMNLPGLGRVEAIERRGRQWVVVTPKGFIAER